MISASSVLGLTLPLECRTRLIPALLAVFPCCVGIAVDYLPAVQISSATLLLTAAAVLAAPLMHGANALGAELERTLYSRWGGRPAVRMLRHRDTNLLAETKRNLHAQFAVRLGIDFPTAADEQLDPEKADRKYALAVEWLERHSPDRTALALLRQSRLDYAFWRNCAALRWLGIAMCCGTMLCTLVSVESGPQLEVVLSPSVRAGSPLVITVSIALASFWCFVVTTERVHRIAQMHDKDLIESKGIGLVSH